MGAARSEGIASTGDEALLANTVPGDAGGGGSVGALTANLEVGVLIRDPAVAGALEAHVAG